jgi:hypothetical protein
MALDVRLLALDEEASFVAFLNETKAAIAGLIREPMMRELGLD